MPTPADSAPTALTLVDSAVEFPSVEPQTAESQPVRRYFWWIACILIGLLLAGASSAFYVASHGGWYESMPLAAAAVSGAEPPLSEKELRSRFKTLSPRGVYVVVDSYHNRLKVFRDGELMRDAVCSTGSGTILRDPETGREWVFDTPLGEHRVQRKQVDPVWWKPDWAFIEEGFKPPKSSRDRVDPDSLGEYGLYLGDGYIIHGTIFQTLLGQPITHGCIRLGDDDLEYVYQKVPVGARVYLY